MRNEIDDWLRGKLDEEINEMADEREKYLTESEEFKDIHLSEERKARLHQMVEEDEKRREKETATRRRLRFRPLLVAAAAMILLFGYGIASSGNRVFVPEVQERAHGDETTIKINNTEATPSELDEEEICQEIEEKLGVVAVRLMYKPEGMELVEYEIKEKGNYAVVEYEYNGNKFHVYIRKDNKRTSINSEAGGEKIEDIVVASCGIEVPIHHYEDSEEEKIYETCFEYLNTYYSLDGAIEKSEFVKIIENILFKKE